MKLIIATLFIIFTFSLHANTGVKLSIIRTGVANTYEWLNLEKGEYKKIVSNHSAFLVEHPMGNILIDTGLGEKIDEQFREIPFYLRGAFAYEKEATAKAQLEKEKIDFKFLLITHIHFDHVSGLVDFPSKEIWALPEEIAFKNTATPPAVLQSQVNSPDIKWRPYSLYPTNFMGFKENFDIYGDQSLVIVPLRGHTLGSIGVIVTLSSGKKIFLIGDTVWRKKGIDLKRGKFWLSSKLVDNDANQTLKLINKLHDFQNEHPEIIIMPSHDESVQAPFGYFPKRIE
jgi:glyoxylase-like metal-dependent hydrolase (beta-lactamase superfamily II)